MKPYGQFCPLAQATQLLCERWTLLVVRELIAGSTRFNELQKGVPLIAINRVRLEFIPLPFKYKILPLSKSLDNRP